MDDERLPRKLDNEINEFEKKVTPLKVKNKKDLFFFRCNKKDGRFRIKTCDNIHFRHAGYVEMVVPFIRADKQKGMSADSFSVKVCTRCRSCYIWYNEQMHDITDIIDVKAWEKTEKVMQKMTGPGGDC